ncbi:MAG: hypothetical protein H8K03_01700 [Nitrospira sp.]
MFHKVDGCLSNKDTRGTVQSVTRWFAEDSMLRGIEAAAQGRAESVSRRSGMRAVMVCGARWSEMHSQFFE